MILYRQKIGILFLWVIDETHKYTKAKREPANVRIFVHRNFVAGLTFVGQQSCIRVMIEARRMYTARVCTWVRGRQIKGHDFMRA